jgi:hypothetical protein
VALAFYVVGLSYVARRESYRGPVPFWPLLLLAAPILLALAMNYRQFTAGARFGFPSSWFCGSAAACGQFISRGMAATSASSSRTLLAGIVLVDWIAIAPDGSRWLSLLLLALFGLTKWLQQFVPAT